VTVADFLEGLGLAQYLPAFLDNDIDEDILSELTVEDLKDLGIASVGHRRRILLALSAMKAERDAEGNLEARQPDKNQAEAQKLEARAGRPPQAAELDSRKPLAARAEDAAGPDGTAETEVISSPEPVPPAVEPVPERRQLTVVFCDLVGSTALANACDPEVMRGVISDYQKSVTEAITSFEGHLAKFLGDGVLAYFGWPVAQEDAAQRAVQAALSACKGVSKLEGPDGQPLAARVGIATGLVVVGDLIGTRDSQETAVVGETPNLAARLQSLAEPGSVVLAEGTRVLLARGFDLEDLGERELKGFARPQRAWRVTGDRDHKDSFEIERLKSLAPLVGREAELRLLQERWKQAQSGEGQVILLSGEPGIGKSRLLQALQSGLVKEQAVNLRFFCSPQHKDSAFHPLTRQLERAAGIVAQDDQAARLEKLSSKLQDLKIDDHAVLPLLAELLSIETEGLDPLKLEPEEKKAQTLAAFLALIEAEARRQPLLILLEDAHWLDPTSLNFFGLAVQRISDLPVLLVASFRPDFQPPWGAYSHVATLSLTRLSGDQTKDIATRVAGGHSLPPEIVEQIREKTDGVPLFIEEMTKAVLDAGVLEQADGRYRLTGPLPEHVIPSTLQDSLMARLDRLEYAKEIAQIAACIGRFFDQRLLEAVAEKPEGEVSAALERLVESELIFRSGLDSRFLFKHALVLDTAYESLLRSRRQELHGKIAQKLEELYPELAAIEPETLARHFMAARKNEQAVVYWRLAGERAARSNASAEAIRHFQKGLELSATLARKDAVLKREIDMTLALAFIHLMTHGWAAAETAQAFADARRIYDELGDASYLTEVFWGEYTAYLLRGELEQAHAKTREMIEQARRTDDRDTIMMAHRSMVVPNVHMGRLQEAAAHAEKALSLIAQDAARPIGHRFAYDARIVCLLYSAHARLHLGYPDQAEALCQEGLAEARAIGHAPTFVFALGQAALFYYCSERLMEQRALVEEGVAAARKQGFLPWEASNRFWHGYIDVFETRRESALAEMEQAAADWRASNARLLRPCHLLALARAKTELIKFESAMNDVFRAEEILSETGELLYESEMHRCAGNILAQAGRSQQREAERRFERAIACARTRDAKWPELLAARDLARLWADGGRQKEAVELLGPLCDWFTEGETHPVLKETRNFLKGLS
jgi:class 3 adenylate cyclase/predicted ATPase/energy-coupling factor transporter ATP-binding protein EcfA2